MSVARFARAPLLLARASQTRVAVRLLSVQPAARNDAVAKPGTPSPKIKSLVDEISKLTLLEVADLNEQLKAKLNIKDVPMAAAAAAPVAAAPAAAAPVEAAAAQTSFTVKLTKIDAKTKVKAIKAVKDLVPGLNLVEAKKFVEELPQVLKKDVGKEEAEKIKALIVEAGGEVAFE